MRTLRGGLNEDAKARGRGRRRGSFLVEVAISGVLLMVAMALTMRVLGWVGAQRRVWERREWAVQEASNVMERLTSRPFEEVTTDRARNIELSSGARQVLPGAELMVEVAEDDPAGGKGSKRIAVQVRWKNRAEEPDAPVRLTSWIFRGRPGR